MLSTSSHISKKETIVFKKWDELSDNEKTGAITGIVLIVLGALSITTFALTQTGVLQTLLNKWGITFAEKQIFIITIATGVCGGTSLLTGIPSVVLAHYNSNTEVVNTDRQQEPPPEIRKDNAKGDQKRRPPAPTPPIPTQNAVIEAKEVSQKNPSPVLPAAQTTHVVAKKTLKIKEPFLIKSDDYVDSKFLQFLLNDFAGGGEGDSPDRMLVCFKKYVERFCKQFPGYLDTVREGLDAYLVAPSEDKPLDEVSEEILTQLEQKKYLTLAGGYYDGDGGGHALFYELILEKNGTVTFSVTNSGEGLQYHEKDNQGNFYRTLVFSGAALTDLRQGQFLQLLISCTRRRPALKNLDKSVGICEKLSKVEDLYTILLSEWPGSRKVQALNPGKTQRANSCSLQALLKWFKWKCDENHHSWIILWIKLSAFSDYLNNSPHHHSQCISDGLVKIACHFDKMEQHSDIPPSLLEAWKEISVCAHEKKTIALKTEQAHQKKKALSAKEEGMGLEKYELVEPAAIKQQEKFEVSDSYDYSHVFPNHSPPFETLAHLSQSNIAPLIDEMVYRMNMLRLLSNSSEWQEKMPFDALGHLLQLFFYDGTATASMHVPDAFCPDLLNVWMGIYIQARKEDVIAKKVFLEWIRGVRQLTDFYTPELIFDSPRSRQRWLGLVDFIHSEEIKLLSELEQTYSPPENHWTVWNCDWGAKNQWMPFGIKFKKIHPERLGGWGGTGTNPIEKLAELPEMAHFSRQILQSHLSHESGKGKKWIEKDEKERLASIAKQIERWDEAIGENGQTANTVAIEKAIDSFATDIQLLVPHHDVLKFGLAALFVLFDRHLNRPSTWKPSSDVENSAKYVFGKTIVWPDERVRGYFAHPCIKSAADATSRLEAHKSKPESIVATTEKKFKPLIDLNQRIQTVIHEEEREYPFMTLAEEKVFITFVQKADETRVPEMLAFFETCLHKLAIPEYQVLFKHLLFSAKGGELLDHLPHLRPLVFAFFNRGYETLIQNDSSTQAAAAALFHVHLLFFASYPEEEKSDTLVTIWKRLIQIGKSNPVVGKGLGKAVFAALPALEWVYEKFLSHPLASLLATSCLLECIPADFNKEPYSPLDLQYGWHSFKALIDKKEVWQQAAKEVFGDEEASICRYDAERQELCLKTKHIYLTSRTAAGGDEFTMQVIPKEHRNYRFNQTFGSKNILAQVRKSGMMTIYSFKWRNRNYEVRVNSQVKIEIYKEIHSQFYCSGDLHNTFQYFPFNSNSYRFWWKEGICLIEEKESEKVVAQADSTCIQRVDDQGKLVEGRLAMLSDDAQTFLSELIESLHCAYSFWENPRTKRIEHIEFPTLKLNFYEEEGKLQSREFPGFYLAEWQHAPFLKNYRCFICLESKTGQKKVIVPVWPFGSKKHKPYHEEAIYATMSNSGGEKRPHPTFVFDLEKDAESPLLSPRLCNQSKIVWLIVLHLCNHEYHKALTLMQETGICAQRPLQKLTDSILDQCFHDVKDTHPFAIALRLRLGAWQEDKYRVAKDLPLYENLKNSMGRFTLDEITLKKLKKHQSQRNRTPQLDTTKHFGNRNQKSWNFPAELRKKMCEQAALPMCSLTVPGEDLILNFLHFFQLRIEGTSEEQRKMKVIAYFAYGDPTELIANLGCILWHGKKSDLRAIFQIENQEEFNSKLQDYVADLQKKDIEYPYRYRNSICYQASSGKKSFATSWVEQEEKFEPLFPMTFHVQDEKIAVTETRIVGDPQLKEWAIAQKEKYQDEPVRMQFDRLVRGATDAKEDIEVIQPSSFGASEQTLKDKEKAILAKANDLHGVSQLFWQRGREVRQQLDIETLMICLGRKDISVIRHANPSLSDGEIAVIMQEVLEYCCLRMQGAIRAYDPAMRPELAVYEALIKVVLRKDQIEALDSLKPGTLFEARTGFGKSKVLLPLWLLLTGQSGLAIFISPATLFDEQEHYLQNILKRGYHFFATTIEFSRSSPSTAEDILYIENAMKQAEQLRRPVFMSDQTAHNLFVLKLKELSQVGGDAYQALRSLRRYVRTKKVYIDEPHKVLDDRQEFNYSIGGARSIQEKRLRFTIGLYKKLFKVIKGKYQIECWSKESTLTEDIYRKEILPQIVGKKANDYLLGRLNLAQQQDFESELTDESMRVLHDQLHYYLPQSLMLNCDEHYALNDERVANPLENARNPRKNNEYVAIDQILNFTIQANLKRPFSLDEVASYLQKLSRDAAEELGGRQKVGLRNTKAYREFKNLVGGMDPPVSGLLTLESQEIERIWNAINSDFLMKLTFIEKVILPRVRHFDEKVTSTPHLLAHCFQSIVGADGTLSMEHFPHGCQVLANERAMVKTLSALLKMGHPITEMKEECSIACIRTFFPKSSVIIEVGAGLRHYPSLDVVAQEIFLHYPEFDGVATFDDDGNPVVMTRKLAKWMPEAMTSCLKSFWIYGQKDTTGRDKILNEEAEAVVIVNQHTTLTHFVQGVGRMRGILKSQQAKVVIDRDSVPVIRQALQKLEGELTLFNLLEYFAKIEGEGNGNTNFRSLGLQLDAVVENQFWDEVLEGKRVELQTHRELIVQSTKDDPLLRPSYTRTPIDKESGLKLVMDGFETKVKNLGFNQIEMKKQGIAIQKRMSYPEKVMMHHSFESSQIVETTAEQMAIQQNETVENVHAIEQTETVSMAYSCKSTANEPVKRENMIVPISIETIFSHERLVKYRGLFDGMLSISQNALCTFLGDTPKKSGFVNGYIKPLRYIAELDNNTFVLIDTQEAEDILKNKFPVRSLYLVQQGFLIGSGLHIKGLERQARLLNGDLSGDLQPLEKDWIQQTHSYRAFPT